MGSFKATKRIQRGLTGLVVITIVCITTMAPSVRAQLHPADTDGDYRISLEEMTAYAAAWKGGTAWPTAPNPIPQVYVTNAEFLWKAGEAYTYDATKNPPWVASGITPEQRTKALNDVNAKWISIIATNPTDKYQRMLAYLATRPEFGAYWISDDNDAVWAQFTDGRILIIFDRGTPKSGSSVGMQEMETALASIPKLGLPNSQRVFIFTDGDPSFADPFDDLDFMFKNRQTGYDRGYVNQGKMDLQVDDLKGVKDAAVLYIGSHASRYGQPKTGSIYDVYAIWTNTVRDPDFEAPGGKYEKDFGKGEFGKGEFRPDRLVYIEDGSEEPHYGVTDEFFREYTTFSKNSLVYIDACRSERIKDVFTKKGAVYVGWDNAAEGNCSADRALYFFDRLLGADYYDRVKPPERPFDYRSVIKAMQESKDEKGNSEDKTKCVCNAGLNCVATLVDTPPAGDHFEILAPSIGLMEVYEPLDELWLWGIFGNDPTNARVTVGVRADGTGGSDCPITLWEIQEGMKDVNIHCKIKRTGDGAAGSVQAEVNGHKSNIVPLTEWRNGKFTYTVTGPGDLWAKATFKVRLRGDVHKLRYWPEGDTFLHGFTTFEAQDSTGSFEAGGKFEDSERIITWSVNPDVDKSFTFSALPYGSVSGPWFQLATTLNAPLLPGVPYQGSEFGFGSYLAKPLHYVIVYKKSGNIDSGDCEVRGDFKFDLQANETDYSIGGGEVEPKLTAVCGGTGDSDSSIKFEWTKMIPTEGTTPNKDSTPADPWPPASSGSGQQPLAVGSGAASRDLADCYSPSASSSVAAAVIPGGTTLAYAVEDSPPAGWTVGNIGSGGVWDNVTKKVKWGLFFDSTPRTLTYQVTPQAGDTGAKSFSGTASFDGTNATLGGESNLSLCSGTETISVPSTPSGPATGNPNIAYSYMTGGSISSLGHSVEYQFDWKGDGSDLSGWGSATQSKSWSGAGSYSVRARARCATHTSAASGWSSGFSVAISAPTETVSTPTVPSGTASGTTGTSYSYTTGGSTSSLGHQVEYQVDWRGDGSDLSSWGSATQSKSWSVAGSYNVRARARCKTDTSIVSQWSSALTVTIAAAPAPDLTGQWVSLTQTCKNSRSGKQCKLAGSFTVQNSGSKDTSSSFYLSFYLSSDSTFSSGDDTFLKQVSVGKMKKGTSKKVSLSVSLANGTTASGKNVIAMIDSQNAITELNENNNQIGYGPIP